MSERVPFPITDAEARGKWKPLKTKSFRNTAMAQLTLVRFREFIREPEAVFWTFVFPILLAAGLGIAFRQSGPDKAQSGVVVWRSTSEAADERACREAGNIRASAHDLEVLGNLRRDTLLDVQPFGDSSGALALRTGKIALLVIPGSRPDSVGYVFDQTQSEAANARLLVARAIQPGAGRVDRIKASDTYVTAAGSRYIDVLIHSMLGMN